MTDKLKPCPFCGGEAHSGFEYIREDNAFLCQVGCGVCSIYTYDGWTDDENEEREAIKAWNTRADDWQPIETAPKDGFSKLVYNPASECTEVSTWFDKEKTFVNKSGWYVWLDDTGESGITIKPTHWKPLPEPPKQEKNNEV